jgi:hypothetical protein
MIDWEGAFEYATSEEHMTEFELFLSMSGGGAGNWTDSVPPSLLLPPPPTSSPFLPLLLV